MRLAVSLLIAALSASSCGSTQLGREDRAVRITPAEHVWRPALPEDLRGRFRASSIDGPVAAVLREVDYHFDADRFTGAALVQSEQLDYRVLSGTWRFEDTQLVLGSGAPAKAEIDGDWLRLSSPEGTVLLKRVANEEERP